MHFECANCRRHSFGRQSCYSADSRESFPRILWGKEFELAGVEMPAIYIPRAKPSLTHCTLPARFVISHRSSASEPSRTWRFVGCVRKYCLLAVTEWCAAGPEKREKEMRIVLKFKLELIKAIMCFELGDDDLLSCLTHYQQYASRSSSRSEIRKSMCGRKMMNRFFLWWQSRWKPTREQKLNFQL